VMEKSVTAIFDGEVFRPDEPADLESNTKVRLLFEETPNALELKFSKRKNRGEPYGFLKYLESLELDGPSDRSTNLDEYLYHGKPFPDE
jgi:hypothetical protein